MRPRLTARRPNTPRSVDRTPRRSHVAQRAQVREKCAQMSPRAVAPDFVREITVISRPRLVPELELRLITAVCPLWRATEKDLERIGLEAPYWAFAWPGGQALARFVLDH